MRGNIVIFYISFILSLHGINSLEFIPQIIESIETAVILDKSTAYLNCTMVISEELKSKAQWYNADEKKIIAWGATLEQPVRKDNYGNDKYKVSFIHQRPKFVPTMPGQSNDVWNYQLEIRDIIDIDSKNYLCKIELEGFTPETRPSAMGKVVLQKAPFITPIKSQIITEGSPLTLECIANGSPKPQVSWMKANGQPFPLPGFPQRVQNATLYLPKVGKDDRGVFRCHAVNNVGFSHQFDVMIEVTYKPTVRQARRMGAYPQMGNQNFEIMIECIINGYPDPDLFWYKGVYDPTKTNKLLMDDDRHESQKIVSYGAVGTNVTDVFFVLRILNVVESDFGIYTCMASNIVGSDQTNVTIFRQQVCQGALCYYYETEGNFAQVPRQTLEILLVLLGTIGFMHIRLM